MKRSHSKEIGRVIQVRKRRYTVAVRQYFEDEGGGRYVLIVGGKKITLNKDQLEIIQGLKG